MNPEECIDFFFKPESIALIGASPNPEKLSHTILKSLRNMNFKGKIYPVNPGYEEIEGLKCYSTPGEIKDRIDIAIFAVPAKAVFEILKECGKYKRSHNCELRLSGNWSQRKENGRRPEGSFKRERNQGYGSQLSRNI